MTPWWRSEASRDPWRSTTPDDVPTPDRRLVSAVLICCVLFCAAVLVLAVVGS